MKLRTFYAYIRRSNADKLAAATKSLEVSEKFPVYSIAKPFLTQTVLELGLPLTDRIGQHLSVISEPYADRRIDQLLNHTSGLADYSALAAYGQAVDNHTDAWSREELLERTAVLNHNIDGFNYSNIGYLLLRMLVEEKTGLSMFGAIKSLVLDALAIDSFEEWEAHSDIVQIYDPRWVYSGTFLADAESIRRGFAKLVRHRAETIGLDAGMSLLPYQGTGFDQPGYSYGFMNDVDLATSQPKFAGHGGGGPGFSHMILVNTANWQVGLETSTADFDQTAAITRLRAEIS